MHWNDEWIKASGLDITCFDTNIGIRARETMSVIVNSQIFGICMREFFLKCMLTFVYVWMDDEKRKNKK